MNRREFVVSTFACAVGLCAAPRIFGQRKTIEPDLAQLAGGTGLKLFNRSATSIADGARKGVRLNDSHGDGVAYMQGLELANGTIESFASARNVAITGFSVRRYPLDKSRYEVLVEVRNYSDRAERVHRFKPWRRWRWSIRRVNDAAAVPASSETELMKRQPPVQSRRGLE